MAHRMLRSCPNCGEKLEATRLECTGCGTVIQARYEPCRFCSVAPEDLRFIEDFVKYRGNLKEMERVQGESYWTLRTRLGELIKRLGYEEPEPTAAAEETLAKRRQVLDRLEAGEIAPAEAAKQLVALGPARGQA